MGASGFLSVTCASGPQESELLRLKAFVLFGRLAKVVGISKKHFFKEEVKKAWIPLLLHCQDPCPDAAQVGHPLRSVSPSGGTADPERRLSGGPPPASPHRPRSSCRAGEGAVPAPRPPGLLRRLA